MGSCNKNKSFINNKVRNCYESAIAINNGFKNSIINNLFEFQSYLNKTHILIFNENGFDIETVVFVEVFFSRLILVMI
jgi:hypothetical protein